MRKILVVFDALNFKPEVLDFAASIARIADSGIYGLLVYDTRMATMPGVNMLAGQAYVEEIVITVEDQKAHELRISENLAAFRDACFARKASADVQLMRGIPSDVIIQESRFADLMIIHPSLTFDAQVNVPTDFVKDILKGAECPVLVAAEVNRPVTEVVIAYDGSRQSMHAIKQFCAQLPAMCSRKATVLHVIEDGRHDLFDEHNDSFQSWLSIHFPDCTIVSLAGNAQDVLFNYFVEQEGNTKLLVAGAYGRSAISRFFRPSATDEVLEKVDVPLFIAHM